MRRIQKRRASLCEFEEAGSRYHGNNAHRSHYRSAISRVSLPFLRSLRMFRLASSVLPLLYSSILLSSVALRSTLYLSYTIAVTASIPLLFWLSSSIQSTRGTSGLGRSLKSIDNRFFFFTHTAAKATRIILPLSNTFIEYTK